MLVSANNSNLTIAVCGLGFYRRDFVFELLKKVDRQISIYCGADYEKNFIPVINEYFPEIVTCGSFKLPKGFLLVKFPLKKLLTTNVLVMDLNPRALHVLPLVLVRRFLGLKTLLWGHAFSRSGSENKFGWVRNFLRLAASGLIVYTETEKDLLSTLHVGKPIFSAPNSLYPAHKLGFSPLTKRYRILYIGRLIASKKPNLLISAFASSPYLTENYCLTIVGDGELRSELNQQAVNLELGKSFELLGHVDDFERLSDLYGEAIVSVSPGYVGLSLIQSTGFGVPIVIADKEYHAPEIEGFSDGVNGIMFSSNDSMSLANALIQITTSSDYWLKRGDNIAAVSQNAYNTELMAQNFLAAMLEMET